MNVLFVNHKKQRCGVQQFGQRVYDIVSRSDKLNFAYLGTESPGEFTRTVRDFKPRAVIYNYYPSTMRWADSRHVKRWSGQFTQVGIFHEVKNNHFDYYIHADPTAKEDGKTFITGRPLLNLEVTMYAGKYDTGRFIPVIGTFGFGFRNKGYDRIVNRVEDEFDEAVINFQISFAQFGDNDGRMAKEWDAKLKQVVTKPGIELNITHSFLTNPQLLDFLASNDVNVFMYDELYGRGIASTTDYCLSVRRPIALTKSYMFRHLWDAEPSIFLENTSLKEVIRNGITPLERYYEEFSNERLIKDYERILEQVTSQ